MAAEVDPHRLARELASLARLALTEGEVARFGNQVSTILRYIDSLRTVDVDGVPEYLSARQPGSGLRSDEPDVIGDREAALAGVPARRGRAVLVPKFKED